MTVLLITFIAAIIVNVGMAVCVLRYKEIRTPTNLCLVNLAAADLLFALGIPVVAYTRLTQSWELGDAVCALLPYSEVILLFFFPLSVIIIAHKSLIVTTTIRIRKVNAPVKSKMWFHLFFRSMYYIFRKNI